MKPYPKPLFFALFVGVVAPLWTSLLPAADAVTVASVFDDEMVLQRGMPIPVWGTADPGSVVAVHFGEQMHETKAGTKGEWRVTLDSMMASAEPAKMTVTGGTSKLTFEDVLVGEVWLCSGQSNMQFKLSSCEDAPAEIAAANHPLLRLNTTRGWQTCTPETVASFSGVAYFFGRKLIEETGVPVGLIARAVGGTPVEWWTPAEKLGRVPFAKAAMTAKSPDWIQYEKAVAEWKVKLKNGNRKTAGKKPTAPGSAEEGVLAGIYSEGKPGSLYRQHLEAVEGYGISGAIWYQGERNSKAGTENATAYRPLLANMITSWRENWGQGDFAFIAVQLPSFAGGGKGWAMVQDAQAAAVSDVANAGYIDIRDQADGGLHPKNKKPVGERLASLAKKEFVK